MEGETERTGAGDDSGANLGPHAARAAGDRLREIAEREHAQVEKDERAAQVRDDDDERADVPVDEPHPLAGLAEPITDENLTLLGPAATGMAPCPFCAGYGAVDPDQLIAALPNVIQALAPYPASTVFVRCKECDGWGSVLTGGRTGDNGIQPCPACSSHGYIDTRDATLRAGGVTTLVGHLDPDATYTDRDPFTLPPPEGAPPAAGMEWDSDVNRWQYPTRAA